MSALATFPASPPLIAVARVLGRFDRSTLEAFLTVAVELLDVADGDADLEENADREASDGDDQDQAWIEWHAMHGSQKRGDKLRAALAKIGKWTLEIIKRSDTAKGFVLLPRRWVVERTFAWLGRNRRLAKDFERTIESATAWLYLASVQQITRRIASL